MMKSLAALSALCLLLSEKSVLAAEEPVEEVLVTASPFQKNSEALNHPADVLIDAELHQAASATLGETLQNQLGVSSASFGPGVGLPIIRGQSDNRVKVMQDSVGSMDASAASPDHAISLEPLLAKRIEILRGPAALRYGSGAIGGVVNVIDNRIPDQQPTRTTGGFELRGDTNNRETDAVVSLTSPLNNFAWHLDGLARNSDDTHIPGSAFSNPAIAENFSLNKIENTSAHTQAASAGGSYFYEGGFFGASVNHLDNNYGVPPDGDEKVRIDLHQTRSDFKGEQLNPWDGIEKINWHLGVANYQHTEIESGVPGTVFRNHAFEGRAEAIQPAIKNDDEKSQGAMGVQLSQSILSAVGEEAFIPKSTTQTLGVFGLKDYEFGKFSADLGARYEWESITPENQTLYGNAHTFSALNFSVTGGWQVDDHQKWSLSLAHSQRAPSVEELMADGPHPATGAYLVGDSTLNSEVSNNLELGYHWHNSFIESSINAYYNRVDDFIYARNEDQIRDALNLYQYTQAGARFMGYEAEINVALSHAFNVRLFSDSVRANLIQSGENLPRIPPLRFGVDFGYEQGAWSAQLKLLHANAQNRVGDFESVTESYSRVDGFVNYTVRLGDREYLYFVKITNLTNAEIRNASSYLREVAPEAGRALHLGLRVQF